MPSETDQPTIFLSYAHADAKCAQQLAAALTARGYTVWWDNLIEGGAQFAKSIRAALESADAVVVLWSPSSYSFSRVVPKPFCENSRAGCRAKWPNPTTPCSPASTPARPSTG